MATVSVTEKAKDSWELCVVIKSEVADVAL